MFKFYTKKPHKYFAKSKVIDDIKFASTAEADFYCSLKLQEKAGLIRIEETQSKIYLTIARILYRPDFLVYDLRTKKHRWLEVKGVQTPVWRIKRKLWIHYGPGRLEIYKKSGNNFKLLETIESKLGENYEHYKAFDQKLSISKRSLDRTRTNKSNRRSKQPGQDDHSKSN